MSSSTSGVAYQPNRVVPINTSAKSPSADWVSEGCKRPGALLGGMPDSYGLLTNKELFADNAAVIYGIDTLEFTFTRPHFTVHDGHKFRQKGQGRSNALNAQGQPKWRSSNYVLFRTPGGQQVCSKEVYYRDGALNSTDHTAPQ